MIPASSFTSASLVAFVAGLLSALAAGYFLVPNASDPYQITATETDSVHVHADFLMYLDHEQYRFTDDQYQSTSEEVQHSHLHLHNNNDHVIHRHAPDLTFVSFLDSLGYTLTEECLVTDAGESFCTTENGNTLQIYVNGTAIDTHTEYVFADGDQILVYYGDPTDERVDTYLNAITDDACLHSGTCPERGTAPPEECGITCEI